MKKIYYANEIEKYRATLKKIEKYKIVGETKSLYLIKKKINQIEEVKTTRKQGFDFMFYDTYQEAKISVIHNKYKNIKAMKDKIKDLEELIYDEEISLKAVYEFTDY